MGILSFYYTNISLIYFDFKIFEYNNSHVETCIINNTLKHKQMTLNVFVWTLEGAVILSQSLCGFWTLNTL